MDMYHSIGFGCTSWQISVIFGTAEYLRYPDGTSAAHKGCPFLSSLLPVAQHSQKMAINLDSIKKNAKFLGKFFSCDRICQLRFLGR